MELLVVITIIVILTALSFLSFSRLRTAADRASVAASLRQLQFANQSYAGDHNGRYLPLSSMDENQNRINEWHQNSLFLSYHTGDSNTLDSNQNASPKVPLNLLDPAVVRAKKRLWDRLFASYGYNSVGMPAPSPGTDQSFLVSQVTSPARTAAFITATDWIVDYSGRFLWEEDPVEGKTTDQRIAYRHGGKAVVVYYDGSSGLISPNDIRNFDKQGGANHPFWKADH